MHGLINLLRDISNTDDYCDFICNKALNLGFYKEKNSQYNTFVKNMQDNYKDFKLNQVFLITHSKSLIYSNFANGINYVIDDEMEVINYQTKEKKLREVGISYIFDKVLFVEGETDLELLSSCLDKYNIKIHKLGGCGEVIKAFETVCELDKYIKDCQFVFLIDKDSRDSEEIDNIRTLYGEKFDKYFIIMDRHEIENYLLDSKIIRKSLLNYEDGKYTALTEEEIEIMMKKIANEQKKSSKQKYLNNKIYNSIQKQLNGLIRKREIPVTNKNEYSDYIRDSFNIDGQFGLVIDKLINYFDCMSEFYSDDNWNENWKNICNGKSVFGALTKQLADQARIDTEKLKDSIRYLSANEKESDLYCLIDEIMGKFKIKKI